MSLARDALRNVSVSFSVAPPCASTRLRLGMSDCALRPPRCVLRATRVALTDRLPLLPTVSCSEREPRLHIPPPTHQPLSPVTHLVSGVVTGEAVKRPSDEVSTLTVAERSEVSVILKILTHAVLDVDVKPGQLRKSGIKPATVC